MNSILQYSANIFVRPFLKYYLRKERTYFYKGLKLIVMPGVFHPGFFFSTKYLVDFIDRLDLKGKKFCEPGMGSGLVSLHALRKSATVVSFDVNPIAVENCRKNFEINRSVFDKGISFEIMESDLFDKIPVQSFDYIIVNPPYFFGNAKDDAAKAWYAGEGGEYFEKLFSQVFSYINSASKFYMILADNCDLDRIKEIAGKYNFGFYLLESKKVYWETNYIFEIKKK
jgi:release factor glutamine methyltransferase